MARIKITPEEVEAVAKQVTQTRAQSEQLINTLKGKIESLKGQWEGVSQERFFNEFEAAKKNMTSYLDRLESISKELQQAATKFRQADQSK